MPSTPRCELQLPGSTPTKNAWESRCQKHIWGFWVTESVPAGCLWSPNLGVKPWLHQWNDRTLQVSSCAAQVFESSSLCCLFMSFNVPQNDIKATITGSTWRFCFILTSTLCWVQTRFHNAAVWMHKNTILHNTAWIILPHQAAGGMLIWWILLNKNVCSL